MMALIDGKKKLLALLLTVLVQMAGQAIGLDPVTVDKISVALGVYIIGQGAADIGKHAK